MEILKQCLSNPMSSQSKSVSSSVDQFYKIKAQQGFVLCDSLHPILDRCSTRSRFDKLVTNVKITARNQKPVTQAWNSQKISMDIIDSNFFSSQPTVLYI
ncbi:unnamed protein product [Paramecium octaurelia]|uniref:Uncharacterized protein n=1 Tax=Paramecium octaurelia TaxID=43137 RepID=A0A8S1XD63_PAROT|nr:unnamed protein product [Paramecium octaurelia]